MEEQTHEKSGHAAGIYNATVQNQRCRALLDYIISKEIVIDAPPKVKARAKDKVLRNSGRTPCLNPHN